MIKRYWSLEFLKEINHLLLVYVLPSVKIYLLAPVQTILPELNISAVVLGSRILIITAANLYETKYKLPLATLLRTIICSWTDLQSHTHCVTVTFGLYSAFLACNAIFLRSSLHPRFTVDTMFLQQVKILVYPTKKDSLLWWFFLCSRCNFLFLTDVNKWIVMNAPWTSALIWT